MGWLLRHYWIWALIAFLLGLLITWLLSVRRAKREVPVYDKSSRPVAAGAGAAAGAAAGLAAGDGDRGSSADGEVGVNADADADATVKADAGSGLNGGAGLATGAGLGVGAVGATLAGKDDDDSADADADADAAAGADAGGGVGTVSAFGGGAAVGAGASAGGRDDSDESADVPAETSAPGTAGASSAESASVSAEMSPAGAFGGSGSADEVDSGATLAGAVEADASADGDSTAVGAGALAGAGYTAGRDNGDDGKTVFSSTEAGADTSTTGAGSADTVAADTAGAGVGAAAGLVGAAAATEGSDATKVRAGAYGEGSADPRPDGSAPAGYTIKGNVDSMLFHTEESPYYGRTKAEVWFRTEADATRNGFTRWDRRGDKATLAAPVVPAGKFGEGSADPTEDGSAPAGFSIKGNEDSMLYHTEDSPYYGRTKAEIWFRTEADATRNGFTRWDRKADDDKGSADTSTRSAGTVGEPLFAGASGTAAPTTSNGGSAVPAGAYGEGSADPRPDGSAPSGYIIKGNVDSMLFHTEESPYYGRTKAEVWFRTEADATRAGFTRWDRKGDKATLAAPVVPAGKFGEGSADPTEDGSAPAGFSIKGNEDSMLFHTEESPYYGRTKAEIWFRTEADATRSGFTRWDRN